MRIDERHWNWTFGGAPIFVPQEGPLPRIRLPGGMRLTLVSPPLPALVALKREWRKALDRRGLDGHDAAAFAELLREKAVYRGVEEQDRSVLTVESAAMAVGRLDDAVANGSSIAFIAEYGGKSVALLGDAHMPPVEEALRRHARLDAVKMAHHGSDGNITRGFVDLVDCACWLVSTDGSIFGHPDDGALEHVTGGVPGARLFFNYRSERTAPWGEPGMRHAHGHHACFPAREGQGLVFDVFASSPA